MIKYLLKLPILKRLIPSISIRLLSILNKNRGYFKINKILMFLDFLDPIDRQIILTKEYEKEEFLIFSNLIKKNSIKNFIDIGANCGFYTFQLSNDLNVFAFEPNLEAYGKLKKTLNKNNIFKDKIKLYPFGISDRNSVLKMKTKVKFGYIQTGGSSVTNPIEEDGFEIFDANFKIGDEVLNLNNQKLAIKIDVEGHELNVLKGITRLINNNNCFIQIEVFKNNFIEVDDFLRANNFSKVYSVLNRSNYFYSNFSNL
tara:strand:- start:66 stop:836 length:771 start_codon:yes stop_codon:yes gene_type:complete